MDVQVIDGEASAALDHAVTALATMLESHWDLADAARRAKSLSNRKRTDLAAIPSISRGDYVLYAVHVPDTKLDYVWRGPGQVLYRVNPQVFIVEPVAVEHVRPFPIHVQRLRRFASSDLGITEQIRMDVIRDHPDNVVQKLTQHRYDGALWFKIRWLGFSAARDSWQLASELAESCPDTIVSYYRRRRTKRTPELVTFIRKHFPAIDDTATLYQSVSRSRDFPVRRRAHARRTTTGAASVPAPANNGVVDARGPPRRGRPRKPADGAQKSVMAPAPTNAEAVKARDARASNRSARKAGTMKTKGTTRADTSTNEVNTASKATRGANVPDQPSRRRRGRPRKQPQRPPASAEALSPVTPPQPGPPTRARVPRGRGGRRGRGRRGRRGRMDRMGGRSAPVRTRPGGGGLDMSPTEQKRNRPRRQAPAGVTGAGEPSRYPLRNRTPPTPDDYARQLPNAW